MLCNHQHHPSPIYTCVRVYIYIYIYIYIYTHTHAHICIYLTFFLSTHPLINTLFLYLGISNAAAMNMRVQLFLQDSAFNSSGYTPRSGHARSYSSSIFNLLRNFCTVFYSSCTNLHFHQQCTRIPFTPYLRQHLSYLVFLMIPILTGARCYHIVVLICIP